MPSSNWPEPAVQSTTKTDFPHQLIESLTRHQFGSSLEIAQIAPLTEGWFNTAYQIHFTNHTPDAVLRIAPPPGMRLLTYEADMMKKEILVNQVLGTMPSVPVPRLLGWNFERDLIDRDYMFVEKLRGTPLNQVQDQLAPVEVAMIHRQLGEIVREIYARKGSSWGYLGDGLGHTAGTWREAFLTIVAALLQDGEDLGVLLPMPYDDIRILFDQHATALEDIQEPVLVHWDLWPANIFIVRRQGLPVIEGIIDWERALWGDPESEPAIAASVYGADFFTGYGRQLTSGPQAEIRRCLYGLYLLLVMVIEAKIRFENADHLGWVKPQLASQLQHLSQL